MAIATVILLGSPSEAVSIVNSAIDDLVGRGGVVSAEERQELVEVMEQRLGIPPDEAEAMIERWQQEARTIYEDATPALESAKQEGIDAVDAATDALGTASIWTFTALLFGLVAAGGGAAVGRRPHSWEETPDAHQTDAR